MWQQSTVSQAGGHMTGGESFRSESPLIWRLLVTFFHLLTDVYTLLFLSWKCSFWRLWVSMTTSHHRHRNRLFLLKEWRSFGPHSHSLKPCSTAFVENSLKIVAKLYPNCSRKLSFLFFLWYQLWRSFFARGKRMFSVWSVLEGGPFYLSESSSSEATSHRSQRFH